ncbi:hypothetical protein [Pseudoduganella lutea]|uniref:Uncharacterized protein n=1 Tax=Pseudoduganella lutea TaxID=321985 RepID=A0A4P6L4J0_9BURK|nr:hypothetical protein [Pseudoduganella lutea]QBE65798.1 hypothetical protein EWM63_24795 [Pseudoduganella lutea]
MQNFAPSFQLNIAIDRPIAAALSDVICQVQANNGHVLQMESFTSDAVILHISVRDASYAVLTAMLSAIACVTEKPLASGNIVDRSISQEQLVGRLTVNALSH